MKTGLAEKDKCARNDLFSNSIVENYYEWPGKIYFGSWCRKPGEMIAFHSVSEKIL